MENYGRCRSLIPVSRIHFAAPQSVNVTTPARYAFNPRPSLAEQFDILLHELSPGQSYRLAD